MKTRYSSDEPFPEQPHGRFVVAPVNRHSRPYEPPNSRVNAVDERCSDPSDDLRMDLTLIRVDPLVFERINRPRHDRTRFRCALHPVVFRQRNLVVCQVRVVNETAIYCSP